MLYSFGWPLNKLSERRLEWLWAWLKIECRRGDLPYILYMDRA